MGLVIVIDDKGETAYSDAISITLSRIMKNLAENNIIRFINVTRKKDGIFANFRVKGIRGGAILSAMLSVDISAAEVHPGDTLERIIEECARIAVGEFKKADFQFEGLPSI